MLLALACSADEPRRPADRAHVSEPAIGWDPETYVAHRVDSFLVVDGRLDEHDWVNAPWTADFVDIEGREEAAPRYRTRAKMLWDDTYFYIGAELQDPDLWATLLKRDAVIYQDNDFEVFIDPDGDTHEYYELQINALGTVWDLFLVRPYRDGGPAIDGWDITGLESAVFLDGTLNQPADRDRGWTVELAIPWRSLGGAANVPTPPRPGDQWRVNLSRVQWPLEVRDGQYGKALNPETGEISEDNWVWSPQGLVNMHYPEMWGFVQFTAEPPSSATTVAPVPQREYTKWILRRIYYRERNWYARYGWYTDNLAALELQTVPLSAHPWPPTISATPSSFEASLRTPDGELIRIFADGRVR